MKPELKAALAQSVAWCVERNVQIPTDTLVALHRQGVDITQGRKSADYFARQITGLVRNLYNRTMDELEFVQIFQDLIAGQLRRAWYDGMAKNGLSPDDMTADMETELETLIDEEHGELLSFAEDIIAQEGQDHLSGENHLDQLLTRGELWAGRYMDVVNQAVLFTAEDADKIMWNLGQTEKHCATCATLDGTVASAKAWRDSGLHPKDPPNERLECEGWRCDCSLDPTDEPLTKGGIPDV